MPPGKNLGVHLLDIPTAGSWVFTALGLQAHRWVSWHRQWSESSNSPNRTVGPEAGEGGELLRGRDLAERPLPAWGGWREGARVAWRCRVGGEGRSLRPPTFLQAPGCRPSCYSSGLEPSSGAAAARTTLAARRSVVVGGLGWVRWEPLLITHPSSRLGLYT